MLDVSSTGVRGGLDDPKASSLLSLYSSSIGFREASSRLLSSDTDDDVFP